MSLAARLTDMKKKGRLKGRKKKGLSAEKARMMLHDNSAQGHPLTDKQRGLFGLIASGKRPTRTK